MKSEAKGNRSLGQVGTEEGERLCQEREHVLGSQTDVKGGEEFLRQIQSYYPSPIYQQLN